MAEQQPQGLVSSVLCLVAAASLCFAGSSVRFNVLCRAVHCRVTSVLHCPEISSIAAASLDKTVSMTDLEKCIAVRTLKGATNTAHHTCDNQPVHVMLLC